ncbi:MAG: N-6 DNA methylase [Saprospiraceae bacterium]|nr:MAG: type I restriction-modification system methyltransferase subunit [Bacteroidetes bacterium OLB9]MCO6462888.1 N-6 DNA methylase [Saprospiraceae bacterium]
MQKQIALEKIKSLVQRFEEQKEFYKRAEYNETQTRRDFIDPFWKALGWDIDNENGYAESYREVIHEDRVKVGGATKAPDYSFRLVGGKRLFFLEAKKPSVLIKNDIHPAYQVRRYGWSAKMPISIISDFEEFAIYDCNTKPKPNDKASTGRIKYMTYENYISEFDFIWDTFAKESVLKGSFDKFLASDKNKKGTSTVDKEFLQSLDKWRKELALNIALRNKNITEEELNFVVQHTIDRLIFLRIAEDRSVEPYGDLQIDIKTGEYYKNLLFRFHQADQKYNSGLFDFEKDKISGIISIDNKVIKSIIAELYYPLCPYEFSVLSVEILGSAYEQFLGKQISLSANGRAIIEEKPEVRKAGGVYYTPQYIVDYIVKNTIGTQIQNKTPKEVAELKIVDPACGSGSFLIGAYQYLLDWHKDYYSNNGKPSKGNKNNPLTPLGELTTAEKKRILLNNIYGVDLDSNAVEVTKLSLLLKCMEGETKETIETQTKLFHDRILPTLDNNIKSGNSLIDLDYYDNELDFGEEKKVKPFSWQKAFPDVFKNGGFDCVIGNPPYGAELSKELQSYCLKKYNIGNTDTAALFMIQSKNLLTKNGINGFIIPKSFTYASNWARTRELLLDDISIIVDCSKVWKEVKLEMSIYISEKGKKSKTFISSIRDKENIIIIGNIEKRLCYEFDFILNGVSDKEIDIGIKLRKSNFVLNDFVENRQGIPNQKYVEKKCSDYKVIGGAELFRYRNISNIKGYIDKKYIDNNCAYLLENSVFVQRIVAHIANPKPHIKFIATVFNNIKLDEYIIVNTVIQLINKSTYHKNFITAIVNSKIVNWYALRFIFANAIRTMQFYNPTTSKIPFPKLDLKLKSDKLKHDEIVKSVDLLLQLNKDKQNITLPSQLEMIENRIAYAENKINQIVYELYDLTEDEIKIIEAN